jgi:hypothetical protein
MPDELAQSMADDEYQKIRDIMHGYLMTGKAFALGISLVFSMSILVYCIAKDDYSAMGHSWLVGIPWGLCPGIAISMAKRKVDAEVLNPKGMTLICGCLAYQIVFAAPQVMTAKKATDGMLEAQPITDTLAKCDDKARSGVVFGQRERQGAPASYGTLELTHSSKDDVCEEIVRNMYSHIRDGGTRSELIRAHNMKIVYVPEEDLSDLMQVYSSKQMCDLRSRLKSEDGARRSLRFFRNDGSSFSADGC